MNTISTNNDLQCTTKKTKDRATRTPLKTRAERMCSGRVRTSCFSSDTRHATLLINDKGCIVTVVTILTKVWSCSIFNSYGIRLLENNHCLWIVLGCYTNILPPPSWSNFFKWLLLHLQAKHFIANYVPIFHIIILLLSWGPSSQGLYGSWIYWPLQYSWNIVKSGVTHHSPNPILSWLRYEKYIAKYYIEIQFYKHEYFSRVFLYGSKTN
jgi:hypothetical protein